MTNRVKPSQGAWVGLRFVEGVVSLLILARNKPTTNLKKSMKTVGNKMNSENTGK